MSPNSIFAVVTEEAYSGHKSMKLGAGDWAYDKTEMSLDYPDKLLPTSGAIYWTTHIWISQGIENSHGNVIDWLLPLGQIRVHAGTGWEISIALQGPTLAFGSLGNYSLTPQVWHSVTIGMDIPNNRWAGMWIDGSQPFISADGAQGYDYDPTGSLGYRVFSIFVVPGIDYQSINALGQTDGFYIYVDDVALTTAQYSENVTSTATTTSINTMRTSSTVLGSSTTQPVPESIAPGFETVFLASILLIVLRRRPRRTY